VAGFDEQLMLAFPVEPVPEALFDKRYPCDSDQDDAALLQGMAWTDVAPEFWRDHWWGLTSLRPEAFVYYLPSVLGISVTDDLPYDLVRGSLIHVLDTSADSATIPHFTWDRMLLLGPPEFECLETWCAIVASKGWFDDTLQQERVELTVTVLKDEARKRANSPARP
jgi:hypothetical protein